MTAQEQQTPDGGFGRNIWSVAAGLIVAFLVPALAFVVVAFNFPADYRLPAAGPPPVWITQTYVLASVLASVLGGFVTARVAPQCARRNVLVLAALWFVVQLAFFRVPANALLFEVVRMAVISSAALLGGQLKRVN